MNITNKHPYFPVEHTTLEHRVLIFYPMYLYVQERIQRVHFLTRQTIDNKNMALDT